MKEYLEDKSEGKVFTKVRLVGHFLAILYVLKLFLMIKENGVQSFSMDYIVMILFSLVNWFFLLPVVLFGCNLLIIANDEKGGRNIFQRQFIYYIWTPFSALILLFLLAGQPAG